MKTLVIHPKDSTTDMLIDIYSDKDWTVINTNVSKKYLKIIQLNSTTIEYLIRYSLRIHLKIFFVEEIKL